MQQENVIQNIKQDVLPFHLSWVGLCEVHRGQRRRRERWRRRTLARSESGAPKVGSRSRPIRRERRSLTSSSLRGRRRRRSRPSWRCTSPGDEPTLGSSPSVGWPRRSGMSRTSFAVMRRSSFWVVKMRINLSNDNGASASPERHVGVIRTSHKRHSNANSNM